MDNRGQTGVVTYFLTISVFLLIWAFGLASAISSWGQLAIQSNSMTGLEALLYGNVNAFIFIFLLIATAAVTYSSFAGAQQ